MKIAVVGLGAIGTHLAAHLASVPGVSVSALVRSGPAARRYVRVERPGGGSGGEILVSSVPADLGPQDAVFVTVKNPQLRAVAPQIATLTSRDTMVVPPSSTIPFWYFNGLPGFEQADTQWLDAGGTIAAAIPAANVIGCAFWVGATLREPGVVTQEGAVAGYPLGEPSGEKTKRVQRLSSVLASAGLRAPVRSDIRSEIWMKLINSLCWNTLAVLTCAEMSQMRDANAVPGIARRMVEEAERVAAFFGAVMPVAIDKRVGTALAADGHRMSSLQDLRAGRRPELDDLAESFGRMQQLSGIPTPLIDDLTALAALRSSTLVMEHQQ